MSAARPTMADDYDMFDVEALRDPQTHDAVIRERGPVVYMPRYDVWATGRHEAIQRMMRDWEVFSSTRPAFEKRAGGILLSQDPPEHTRARQVIQRALSPAVLRQVKDAFEEQAERLVSELLERGGDVDGHHEIAMAYVLRVFPDALGLGEEGRENLVRFGHAAFNAFGPDNEILRESNEQAKDVFAWVEQKAQRDAVAPGGIADSLFVASDNGEITLEEAKALLRSLYSAGSDTTIYLIGKTLKAMIDFPDQWQALREDPTRARAAFEEGIRYDNAARYTRRTTNVAVDVDGVELPADAKILLLHMPGGRDPRRWDRPEIYDIGRDVIGKHLGLGFGVHACVGAPLARMEVVSLLGAMARRVESVELTGEPKVTENMAVHGYEHLPLGLRAA